ncbi:hypothetical protein MtrunA17_Chr8g0361971 [Medicago truncatula]|uniref:Transmembrane protein n=1 Tax=Medicago truncatula TaxID=3880 RepID=A0A396GIX7_MEDTR|nr:hypothetical protein MtrunA17_Chr8g0361971 [Medicago truncatula]
MYLTFIISLQIVNYLLMILRICLNDFIFPSMPCRLASQRKRF